MVHSFILPQETIANIQAQLEILERCLNNATPQDEAMAEILELANSRQISLNQLREEMRQLQYKFDKFLKLVKVLKENLQQGELSVLLFVRYNFLLKEILDKYWDFIFIKHGRKIFTKLICDAENLHITIKNEAEFGTYLKDEVYILEEAIKHLIQSLVIVGSRINILSEEEVNALELADITPKETETMLTSLASTKKWDWVYRNLA